MPCKLCILTATTGRHQSSQNHEMSNMSFRLAALSVILQLSLSLLALTERCKLPCTREEDRGVSSLLQPTLLLYSQSSYFGHTSLEVTNGNSKARGRSHWIHWLFCPDDLFARPTIIFMPPLFLLLFITLLVLLNSTLIHKNSSYQRKHF